MVSPVKLWRNQKNVQKRIGQTGKVVSWTIIRVPPSGFADQAPYIVAIVKLDDGKLVVSQVVDADFSAVRIDMPVRLVIRRILQPDTDGVITYGIKAKPL